MSRRVALLRGINVGRAARIAMSDLAACTEAAGCTDVSTVLATGNVVFTDPRPLDELRGVLEAAYSERFDYTAVVQVLDLGAVAAAVGSYPFETLDQHHDYVVFSDDPAVTARVLDEAAPTLVVVAEATDATRLTSAGVDVLPVIIGCAAAGLCFTLYKGRRKS